MSAVANGEHSDRESSLLQSPAPLVMGVNHEPVTSLPAVATWQRRWGVTCGPARCSWRDAMIAPAEVGLGGNALYSLLCLNNQILAGLYAGAFVLTGAAHCFWRRDATVADLHEVSAQVLSTAELFGGSVKRAEEAVNRVGIITGQVQQERIALTQVNSQLQEQVTRLDVEIKKLHGDIEKLETANGELKANVSILEAKVSQLQKVIQFIKDQVTQQTRNTTDLASDIEKFNSGEKQLEGLSPELLSALKKFDSTFDEDVKDFGEQIKKMQAASLQMFTHVTLLIQGIKEQRILFEKTKGELSEWSRKLQEQEEALQRLQQQSAQEINALREERVAWEKIVSQQKEVQTALGSVATLLETEEEGTETRARHTTDSLGTMMTRLQEMAAQQERQTELLRAIEKDTKKE